MATHSSILAWRIPMDRGAWWATVHGVQRVRHDWVTKHSTGYHYFSCNLLIWKGVVLWILILKLNRILSLVGFDRCFRSLRDLDVNLHSICSSVFSHDVFITMSRTPLWPLVLFFCVTPLLPGRGDPLLIYLLTFTVLHPVSPCPPYFHGDLR